ncbi:F-box At1g67390 [Olea europaea subsp. europaea]|nr:F-box At1g67390 [Olea europaea subsp. europaea]
MNSSTRDVEQELDRISNLPEPIRCLIISRLPIEELVRTSVLSKSWHDTWKNVPHLYFDLTRMTKACREPFYQVKRNRRSHCARNFLPCSEQHINQLHDAARLVNTILNAHSASVTSCRINQFPIGFQEPVESVEYLTRIKGVQELYLTGRPLIRFGPQKLKPLPFPSWGKTLQVLELSKYTIKDASIFKGCDNLHTLRLKIVKLGKESMGEILTYCKALKEISLLNCTGIENLTISNKNLKILELHNISFSLINICAENLAVLVLGNIQCPASCLVIKAPAVVKLDAFHLNRKDCFEMEELLSRCCGILGSCNDAGRPISNRTFYISPFKKLQMLSLNLDLNNIGEAIILSYFFRECFGLKTLKICLPVGRTANLNQASGNQLSYPEYLFWDQKEIFESIENNLSMVHITRFSGTELEMGFAKYIITRAPKMKTIVIDCQDSCTTYVQRLFKLSKASVHLSVFVDHPRLSSVYSSEVNLLVE